MTAKIWSRNAPSVLRTPRSLARRLRGTQVVAVLLRSTTTIQCMVVAVGMVCREALEVRVQVVGPRHQPVLVAVLSSDNYRY